MRDIVGGRPAIREMVAQQMGGDEVIGLEVDHESIHSGHGMLMINTSGMAVKL